ncbi:spindle and kinetochore-associated protein 3 isoform X1 [Phascolarctos cinereus]|uniref:Spindle and kinetochore-associated protein 3 isoform X1 n=1 Tax=Phascolarctos cinereus TaxID=38626 RepID=A0A6P5IQP7_PHACI|nr:spindle and kinetochore-associated protein 3 isoform X1 [Phascolarctos cinereus]
MDPVGKFCGKLRDLAVTLERETAQLQRALNGEDEDFEDSPMRILHDLHLEVKTLKDDVNILLDKSHSERQESNSFIKNTKLLMERNKMDITKIRDLFQKYGYKPSAMEDPVIKENVGDVKQEEANCKNSPKSETEKEDTSRGCVQNNRVSHSPPRSPQLSDFGLEKYMFSRNWNVHPPAMNIPKREQITVHTPLKQTSPKVLRTPKCNLKMDEYAVVTPKLEHFGISEHTMCLNNDYTMVLKNAQKNKSLSKNNTHEVNIEAKLGGSNNILIPPGSVIEQLKENCANHANYPLGPVFFTPGLKVPCRNSSPVLNVSKPEELGLSTNDKEILLHPNFKMGGLKKETKGIIISPTSDSNILPSHLDSEDCTSLVSQSAKYFEHHGELPPPKISDSENLLRTPTPPEVTTIPDDIFQLLSKYDSKLATPIAFKPGSSKALYPKFK